MEDLFLKDTVKKISAKDKAINKTGDEIGKIVAGIISVFQKPEFVFWFIPMFLFVIVTGIICVIQYAVEFWYIGIPALAYPFLLFIYKRAIKKYKKK